MAIGGVYLRLRREGWQVNRKRVYRLYRDAGLAVCRRKRKRIGVFERKPLPKPTRANVSWSMDFVADGLIGGRRLRCLTIVDDCARECLAIEVDTSITGLRVQAVLERLADTRALPMSITVDNGPEFDSQVLDMGVSTRRPAFLHQTRQAERECVYRKLQWQVSRRILQRAPVPEPCTRPEYHRGLAH